MTLPLDFLVSALVTLFVVVDPVGLTPAFIGLTAGLPRNSRRQVALRACLIAFAILAGSALIGDKGVRASRPFMRHHQGCRDGAASGPEREPCGVRKLLFLLLLIAPILTTITSICASNAHG